MPRTVTVEINAHNCPSCIHVIDVSAQGKDPSKWRIGIINRREGTISLANIAVTYKIRIGVITHDDSVRIDTGRVGTFTARSRGIEHCVCTV